MKYIYKALLANTTADEETKKSVIMWDPAFLGTLEDGVISYHELYNVKQPFSWIYV